MSTINNIIDTFTENIGRTAEYELYRKTRYTDLNALQQDINTTKMSDLGTPVLDYVELILESDLWDRKATNARQSAFKSNNLLKQIANNVSAKTYNQTIDNSINPKALHLNNVEVVVNQTSNIVRTSINGVKGTFKEQYSTGDHLISLTGQLTGLIGLQDDLRNLNNFKRIFENTNNDKIIVRSRFINGFSIENVIISDYSMTLNKEFSNVIDFTISLESDKEIEIVTTRVGSEEYTKKQ